MKRFPTQTNKQTKKAKCTSNSFHTIVSVLCERARVPFYPVYPSLLHSHQTPRFSNSFSRFIEPDKYAFKTLSLPLI